MTIKNKCVTQVPCMDDGRKRSLSRNEKLTGMGRLYQPYDHPDLLTALRATARYHEWVENRLMPIVCKWMDENRDKIKPSLSEEEQNDIGASVEAAYQMIADTDFWKDILSAGEKFDFEAAADDKNINPIWRALTEKMYSAEPDT